MTLDTAIREHRPSAVFALFSGGHDSLCSTHLASQHPAFTAAVHINTGIGIEQTREFVRETCFEQGWPLIELHPDAKTYEDLVREKGFPRGPKAHNTTYYWLKQRAVRRLVRDHKQGRNGRVGLVTGIRRQESERRMASTISVPVRRSGAQVWINPILDWSAGDCGRYIADHGLRRNEVSDLLHRSGECLCGALANAAEIVEIERWFPDVAARIHALEDEVREKHPRAYVWARTELAPVFEAQGTLPLCARCEALA
jgi:3'-phosphoadenosine 5'-phosphosulfate sulfotransferase (PAPS reductase)/FAD synthetase